MLRKLPCNGMPFIKSSKLGCNGPKLGCMKSAIPAFAAKIEERKKKTNKINFYLFVIESRRKSDTYQFLWDPEMEMVY